MPEIFHTPIMVEEILQFARNSKPQFIWDGTVGEGGHTLRFAEEFSHATIFASDRDENILTVAKKRLSQFNEKIHFYSANYAQFSSLPDIPRKAFQFVLWDLGVSSFHFDQAGRGFSLKDNASLDMRLTLEDDLTAADLVNQASEKELADLIYRYGEERASRKIARLIVADRPWNNSHDLSEAIRRVMKTPVSHAKRESHIHPATRTLQALRIAVNQELFFLQKGLALLPELMAPQGIAVILSFHSLEDRIVKWAMRHWERPQSIPMEYQEDLKVFLNQSKTVEPLGKVLTPRPLTPSVQEISVNPRSRSTKLRAFLFSDDNKPE